MLRLLNTSRDIAIAVQEIVPGAKENKTLSLASAANKYEVGDPFEGVSNIAFNTATAEEALRNRWSV